MLNCLEFHQIIHCMTCLHTSKTSKYLCSPKMISWAYMACRVL